MHIRVGPAKREGSSRTIFHRSLFAEDVSVRKTVSSIGLSIVAGGIYADGSTYRYELDFGLDELQALINIATGMHIRRCHRAWEVQAPDNWAINPR